MPFAARLPFEKGFSAALKMVILRGPFRNREAALLEGTDSSHTSSSRSAHDTGVRPRRSHGPVSLGGADVPSGRGSHPGLRAALTVPARGSEPGPLGLQRNRSGLRLRADLGPGRPSLPCPECVVKPEEKERNYWNPPEACDNDHRGCVRVRGSQRVCPLHAACGRRGPEEAGMAQGSGRGRGPAAPGAVSSEAGREDEGQAPEGVVQAGTHAPSLQVWSGVCVAFLGGPDPWGHGHGRRCSAETGRRPLGQQDLKPQPF